jgi:3-isopropylmalate dehydratase small subunit
MRLLEGLDDIGLTLKQMAEIKNFEQRLAATQPWLQRAQNSQA